MQSNDKLINQDRLSVGAYLIPPGKISGKINFPGLIVKVQLADGVWHQMNRTQTDINIICDLSISVREGMGQMAHYLEEIFKAVDLSKHEIRIYPLGSTEPLKLRESDHIDIRQQVQQLSSKIPDRHYLNIGTFIEPTLQAIETDYQNRKYSDQPLVMIFSDGEIWDWEQYKRFLQRHQQRHFKFVFIELIGRNKRNPFLSKIREENNRYDVLSRSFDNHFPSLLNEIFSSQASDILGLEKISLKLNTQEIESICDLDLQDGVKVIKSDPYLFRWQPRSDTLGKLFFHRLYFFPGDAPEELTVQSQLAFSGSGETDSMDSIAVLREADSKQLELDLSEPNFQEMVRKSERLCAQRSRWNWNTEMLRWFIDAAANGDKLSRDRFRLVCPNPECTKIMNEPEDWIDHNNRNVQCRVCRQILIHNTKLVPPDHRLGDAKVFLLQIHQAPDGEIRVVEEPFYHKSKTSAGRDMPGFRIYEKGKIELLDETVSCYRLQSTAEAMHYQCQETPGGNQSLQLIPFDVIKSPDTQNPSGSISYFLFLDISKLV